MKVEFVEDGLRLLPETAEENKDLAERFQVTQPLKLGKQKVSLIQAVDKFSQPIENEYFLTIVKDQKTKAVRKKKPSCRKGYAAPIVAEITDVNEGI